MGTGVLTERRRSSRAVVLDRCPAPHVRLRTGATLTIVDVSKHGCLAESAERLLPGRQIDVHVVLTHGRVLVRARVARVYVSAVRRNAIRYRAALAFVEPIDPGPPRLRGR